MKNFSLIPTAIFIFFVSMMLLSPSALHIVSTAIAFYTVMRFINIYRDTMCWSPYVMRHANNRKFWPLQIGIILPLVVIFFSPPIAVIPAILGASLYLIGELLQEAKKDWLIY